MKVDAALILCAGFGSRMGEVGKVLPKVLWPIFEKTILELEINYVQKLFDVSKIFINTHFQADQITSFVKDRALDVQVMHENEILDIGGSVHALAKKLNYTGKVVIINSDQFYMFSSDILNKAAKKLEKYAGVLFTTSFKKAQGYNALEIVDDTYQGKILNQDLSDSSKYETYTGCSLIDLSKLTQVEGKLDFFKDVVSSANSLFATINSDEYEYWDFGTLSRYKQSMFKVLKMLSESKSSEFISFLKEVNSLDMNKLKSKSYGSGENSINLSSYEYSRLCNSILLQGMPKENLNNEIYYNGIKDQLV